MAQLKYDASVAPEPARWLALDEQQAQWLVRQYHASPRCGHPRAENPVLHATIHAVVENQIAMGDETPARSTLERLMREGLSRHDAVHAIGSVLAKHMYGLLGGSRPGGQAGTDLYYDGLRCLTAATWWRGAGDDAREDSPEWLVEGKHVADWSAATPDEIVAALCVAVPHFPREALRAAERAKEQIADRLLTLIAEAHQCTREGASPPGNGHIFAMLLLAELEDPRAFDVIADLFTLPEELCREVGGDFVTEDLGRVLASVCGGRIEPLARIIEDRTRSSFVRGAALAALCALVQRQHVRRETAVAYLVKLTRETLADERSEIWNEVASAVLDLYAYELFADVRRLIGERLIDSFCMTRRDVDYAERKGLATAMAALDRNVHLRPVRDIVAETAWWHSYSDSAGYAQDADPDDCDFATAKTSAMTPVRVIKVGRNDPCPCGSGKKYKKCCLGTD